jgi:peptidoglycan/xylan/chitin deacetylase (PgdA/CDA1 family)
VYGRRELQDLDSPGSGLHGYSHENPTALSPEQQRDILEHTFQQLTDFCGGKPPVGSVAPWWEVSKETTEMLMEKGIIYGESARVACASRARRGRQVEVGTHAQTTRSTTTTRNLTGCVQATAGRKSTTRRRPRRGWSR